MSRMMMNRFGTPMAMPGEMGRLFQSVLGPGAPLLRNVAPEQQNRSFPGVNVWEDESGVYVEAELPGISMDQIDVTMLGADLTISGQRPETQIPEGAVFHRRERPIGRFIRTIHLGTPVDGDKVSASFKNGVLLVTLPKAEAAKPRKIQIKPNVQGRATTTPGQPHQPGRTQPAHAQPGQTQPGQQRRGQQQGQPNQPR